MRNPAGFDEEDGFCGYVPRNGYVVFKKIEDRLGGLVLAENVKGRRAVIDPLSSYEVEAGVFVVSIAEGIVALAS